jgi:hypothetical protein
MQKKKKTNDGGKPPADHTQDLGDAYSQKGGKSTTHEPSAIAALGRHWEIRLSRGYAQDARIEMPIRGHYGSHLSDICVSGIGERNGDSCANEEPGSDSQVG